jgi:hypothetical protein
LGSNGKAPQGLKPACFPFVTAGLKACSTQVINNASYGQPESAANMTENEAAESDAVTLYPWKPRRPITF